MSDKNFDWQNDLIERIINPETFIQNMPTSDLIELIKSLENYEEGSYALTELSQRDKNSLISLCQNILLSDLGDEYLQAIVFNLLYNSDSEKALEVVKVKLDSVSISVLGEIFDNLAADSLQPIGISLSPDFLRSIVNRYLEFNDAEKN